MLIEQLCTCKNYKFETFYQAVSLADQYLVYIARESVVLPCLITLGLTSVLLAAKIEQPVQPSFKRMIRLLEEQH